MTCSPHTIINARVIREYLQTNATYYLSLAYTTSLLVCIFKFYSTMHAGKMDKDNFIKEAQVMKKLSHPNLLKLLAVCTLEEPILIVTERMKHGILLDYLKYGEGQYAALHQCVDMMEHVASGKFCLVKTIFFGRLTHKSLKNSSSVYTQRREETREHCEGFAYLL